MKQIYSVALAALKARVNQATIRRRMKARGIGQRLGREWILTDEDIKTLRIPGVRGNPTWRKK